MAKPATQSDRSDHRSLLGPGLWFFACCIAIGVIWLTERRAQIAELVETGTRLHALASQRVDQHDAHLTALSAVAIAGAGERPDLFREVGATIMRFYPRITSILLVPLDAEAATLGIGKSGADLHDTIRTAARRSEGAPVMVRHPEGGPYYVIVKRSPNSRDARYGLALVIDAVALLAGENDDGLRRTYSLRVSMPDGTALVERGAALTEPLFARTLSSSTQPLRLEASVAITPASLLPPGKVLAVLALISLLGAGIGAVHRQRARMRAAERRAELSGLETRLSHAGRVNALGEMASGMAHELTQPLTAILAQAQAARHLAARDEAGKLGPILDEVVGQTRRAAAILERLRTWTRPQERRPEPVDLRACIEVARTLLAPQAEAVGAVFDMCMPRDAVMVLADRVELEQVLFNLVKNALDAVAGNDTPRRIGVILSADGALAQVDVTDTGPGVRADVRDSLFAPFVTTREGGTGLGLALSHRLVERAGGDLVLVGGPGGARFRITLPLAGEGVGAAA